MTIPQFDNLPDKVTECVDVHLALNDLNSVRSVSHAMLTKTNQRHIRSFLRSRRLDLTRPSQELMAEMTAKHGCSIEELTLVGIVYNTIAVRHQLATRSKELVGDDCDAHGHIHPPIEFGIAADFAQATTELEELELQQADYDRFHAASNNVTLLTQIFANLTANTKLQGLLSIATAVVVFRQNSRTRQPALERLGWRL